MMNMERFAELLRREVPELELRVNEPMSRHTTFRVGGPAALMALPVSGEQMAAAARLALAEGIRPLCVGNGSNLLVDDRGLDVFVIKAAPQMNACRVEGERITASAGILLVQLANTAADHSLTGLEFAHGIPGSLGGAVTMNAGAYEGEMKQVVESVLVLDGQGAQKQIPAEECAFSYRHSAFSEGSSIILGATFLLKSGDPAAIRAKMANLMERRRSKQPLEYPSAGSTFKRPAGYFAAALIDQCGLKGFTVGGAQVSAKHAGFVINTGEATCAHILSLIDQVRERVFRETGVELEPEVKYLR